MSIEKVKNPKIAITEELLTDAIYEFLEDLEDWRDDFIDLQYDTTNELDLDIGDDTRFRITVEEI